MGQIGFTTEKLKDLGRVRKQLKAIVRSFFYLFCMVGFFSAILERKFVWEFDTSNFPKTLIPEVFGDYKIEIASKI